MNATWPLIGAAALGAALLVVIVVFLVRNWPSPLERQIADDEPRPPRSVDEAAKGLSGIHLHIWP